MKANRIIELLLVTSVLISCNRTAQPSYRFITIDADRSLHGSSTYPIALDVSRVGTYPVEVKSGGGYFYDDVLEYRVWLHPDKGAKTLNDNDDYWVSFAQYEQAEAFSKRTPGAEQPLVLVRQREWINEPEHGRFVPEKGERFTEWQVQWLDGSKRSPNSIQEFLKHPKEAGP